MTRHTWRSEGLLAFALVALAVVHVPSAYAGEGSSDTRTDWGAVTAVTGSWAGSDYPFAGLHATGRSCWRSHFCLSAGGVLAYGGGNYGTSPPYSVSGEHLTGGFGAMAEYETANFAIGLGPGVNTATRLSIYGTAPIVPVIGRLRVGPRVTHGFLRYGGADAWWNAGEVAAAGVAKEAEAQGSPWSAALGLALLHVAVGQPGLVPMRETDSLSKLTTIVLRDGIKPSDVYPFALTGQLGWLGERFGWLVQAAIVLPSDMTRSPGLVLSAGVQFGAARRPFPLEVARPQQRLQMELPEPPTPTQPWEHAALRMSVRPPEFAFVQLPAAITPAVLPTVRGKPFDVTQVLRPGRVLIQRFSPLRVRADVAPPQPLTSTCRVDEQVRADGALWTHVSCTPDLPRTAGVAWRTGCYRADLQGLWRLPYCPGAANGRPDTPQLFLPADPERTARGFVDWEQVLAEDVQVAGRVVPAACRHLRADADYRICLASPGLVVSSRKWRRGVTAEPEIAVRLVDLAEEVTTGATPHLQFAHPQSARCEIGPQCAVFGQCARIRGECAASDELSCKKSAVCRRLGRCSPAFGGCVAQSQVDCEHSEDCDDSGRCTLRAGVCGASGENCALSVACAAEGRCTAKDGRCAVTSDAECTQSTQCAFDGLCSYGNGACRAKTDAQCAASTGCKTAGRCVAFGGGCVEPDVSAQRKR